MNTLRVNSIALMSLNFRRRAKAQLNYQRVGATQRMETAKIIEILIRAIIINNLLTSNIRSLQEYLEPQPCCIDLTINCLVNMTRPQFEIFP